MHIPLEVPRGGARPRRTNKCCFILLLVFVLVLVLVLLLLVVVVACTILLGIASFPKTSCLLSSLAVLSGVDWVRSTLGVFQFACASITDPNLD